MQSRKAKYIFFAIIIIFFFFFSNDFGLIDVEKTSIITAIAIDSDPEGYLVTAQIAVPEATDTNSENLKAQIQGKGSTVGGAIKNLGDFSGWFPKLSFCNLILIGNDLAETDVICVLDYFAKTLRVQDSALVALADDKASELLSLATPLDNISAFALQKIMLKNTGFDKDVCSTDVKTFCASHYSLSGSAFMPIVKAIPSEKSTDKSSSETQASTSSGGGGSSGQSDKEKNKNNLFDAGTTALFLDGKLVGKLSPDESLAFNAITSQFKGSSFSVDDVIFNSESTNYLLTVSSAKPSICVRADDLGVNLTIKLNLFCKIVDHSASGSSQALSQNLPIPEEVKQKAEKYFSDNIESLIEKEKQTGCDFLKIKEKLYRFNYKQYSKYENSYLSVLSSSVSVIVEGPK